MTVVPGSLDSFIAEVTVPIDSKLVFAAEPQISKGAGLSLAYVAKLTSDQTPFTNVVQYMNVLY